MSKEEKFYDNLLLKGYGEVTIQNYKQTISKFLRDLETRKPTQKQAESYLIELRKKKYSYSHIKNNIINISRFMEFIRKPIKVEIPRKPQTLPTKDILTEGEIARMMAETKNSREKAMLSILVFNGLRNKEVCSLKVRDIDFENNIIKVIGGKFSKDRIVPISKEEYKILLEYVKDYPRQESEYLFTTIVNNNQYTGWDLRKCIKVIARKSKIQKRVYPHLMRHSLITHLLEKGMNVIAVQQIAGHANLKTTMWYSHYSPQKVQQEFMYYIPSYL